ncbi:molybdate ABC transporter substrate-binding protein [Rhodovulum euryhalinum]|uniref:Molybdate transport system substrate-binding protein n=1 Tax=Rhodovulum euryhalinum TaxID=35805 RepID=A0A4R2KQM6_9RHOB|nr:molybdate ABC transporter substrate-binding protein [Rhodovulum euryhalinum]TCO73246.1 molybdate transport system substrate-binding protein [Rhodovulum euryhalinum]
MTSLKTALVAGTAALLVPLMLAAPVRAGEVIAAVAANFTEPANEIAARFTEATGHTVTMSFGPSGQFYTQITQGAPFEVFLSADAARPEKAEAEGLAVPGTRFTYAIGKLVLWSADTDLIDGTDAVLKSPDLAHVAIADPAAAPYGAAAVETMKALGVYDSLEPKLVTGKSISQAHQFAATGNAPVGFVALSQVIADGTGSRWMVPQELYAPIRQDAVLLKTGEGNEAATAWLDFLKGPEAAAIIEKYGYNVGE